MTERLHDATISVEDLGSPSPLPPELADAIDREDADTDAGAPPADAGLEERKAGWAADVVDLLFRLIGFAGGFRMPAAVKTAIRGVWQIDGEEVAEIGLLLAPIVPERFVSSRTARALGLLGVGAGVLKLAGAVGERAEQTVQLRHEVIVHGQHSPAGAEPATDAGAGRAGSRRGGPAGPAAEQPEPAGAPKPVDGFAGTGLALGEIE